MDDFILDCRNEGIHILRANAPTEQTVHDPL